MSKKLDSILEKVKKTYKVDIPSAKDAGVVERLTLDSPSFNYIFGGGMPLGRMLFLQGPESGGKSSISTYLAMQVQKKYDHKNTVVYLDFEYTFDADHAAEMGLDLDDNFILLRPTNGEDGFNMIKDLVESGEVGLVIIDSVTAMSSKAACEDAFSGFSGGKTAAMIASGIRMLLPYLYNNRCTLIMISQERTNLGVMYGPDFKATGGRAPAFYSSWSARVTRTGDITGPNKELCGLEIRVRNIKNKVGIPKRDANLKLYFNGGIDSDTEYIEFVKSLGLIEQKGAYYSNTTWTLDDGTVGFKVCGFDAVKDILLKNPNLYENLKIEINNIIQGHTILDDQSADLTDEEKAVDAWAEYESEDTK